MTCLFGLIWIGRHGDITPIILQRLYDGSDSPLVLRAPPLVLRVPLPVPCVGALFVVVALRDAQPAYEVCVLLEAPLEFPLVRRPSWRKNWTIVLCCWLQPEVNSSLHESVSETTTLIVKCPL